MKILRESHFRKGKSRMPFKKKPAFRIGQRIQYNRTNYLDGKKDIGYVIGIEARRDMSESGLFQNGGMSYSRIREVGYSKAYIELIDHFDYQICCVYHTTGDMAIIRNVMESDLSKPDSRGIEFKNKTLPPI